MYKQYCVSDMFIIDFKFCLTLHVYLCQGGGGWVQYKDAILPV